MPVSPKTQENETIGRSHNNASTEERTTRGLGKEERVSIITRGLFVSSYAHRFTGC